MVFLVFCMSIVMGGIETVVVEVLEGEERR
jgi:hypothetical protein